MIALLLALQAPDLMVAGEAWARETTPARCYVELSALMPNPNAARDPLVRERMRALAQQMAGLAYDGYYAVDTVKAEWAEARRENQDLVANGLMDKSEADAADAEWGKALQARLYLVREMIVAYPACGFMRPVMGQPGYTEVVSEAMTVTTKPED